MFKLKVFFRKSKKLTFVLSIFLFLISFSIFTYSKGFFPTTDSLPINFTALNLLYNKRLDLTNFRDTLSETGLIGITVSNNKGVIYSKTPPILGLFSLPVFYVCNKVYGVGKLSVKQIVETDYSQYIGKIAASFYSALSSAFIFLIIYKLTKDLSTSLISFFVYVFGTNVFNIASQSNTQHGISLFLINIFLFIFISNPKKKLNIFVSGLIWGLFSQIRVSNGFYIMFPVFYLIVSKKNKNNELLKNILTFLGGGIIIYLSVLSFYKYYSIPYGYEDEILFSIREWSPILYVINLFSLLFSFNFGLFTFSQVLLLIFPIFLFFKKMLRKEERKLFFSLLLVLILYLIFAPSWWMWTGGKSLNARLLSETMPIFIIFLSFVYVYFRNSIVFKFLFVILFSISFLINLLTTYTPDYSWYDKYLKNGHKYQVYNAWFYHPTFIYYLLNNRLFKIEKLYNKKGELIRDIKIYRVNIRTVDKFVKVYEDAQPIL